MTGATLLWSVLAGRRITAAITYTLIVLGREQLARGVSACRRVPDWIPVAYRRLFKHTTSDYLQNISETCRFQLYKNRRVRLTSSGREISSRELAEEQDVV
ncbi:hypothetical protein J6590_043813 [Homalodisca vitripennis]|nr:hypothetical protein J6590_043813 [Homalodisca vitripennis]